MKIKQLKINEAKYNYCVYTCPRSQFPPIFFINGAFQNMQSWDYLATMLKDHTTIIVADLPGWGSADVLAGFHNFSVLASAVNQILEREEIEQVNLISTSYGSLIATAFAEEYREKVAKLMLCSPLLEISGDLRVFYPELREIVDGADSSLLSEFLCTVGLLNCAAGDQGKIDHFEKLKVLFNRKISKLGADQLVKFIHNTDRILNYGTTDLSLIKDVNTIVITGEHDSFTRPEDCFRIAESFTCVRYHSIHRADHMFLFERPRAFAEVILSFFCGAGKVVERRRA